MKKSLSILLLICMLLSMFTGTGFTLRSAAEELMLEPAPAAEEEVVGEETPIEETTGEEPAEETPVEVPVEEEPVEETPAEEPAEEETVEEAVSEEEASVQLEEIAEEVTEDGGYITAETDYTLYLSGGKAYKNSADTANDITETVAAYGLSYDNGTWTMRNFHFTTAAATAVQIAEDAKIQLEGDNSVESTYNNVKVTSSSYGIFVSDTCNLTISGDGILNAIGGVATWSIGLGVSDNLVIESGTVTAIGGMSIYSLGVFCSSSVKINGGSVTAISGEVTAATGHSYGMSTGALAINGGSVTAIGGDCTDSLGIYSTSSVTVAKDMIVKAGADEASAVEVKHEIETNLSAAVQKKYVSIVKGNDYTLYLTNDGLYGKVYKNSKSAENEIKGDELEALGIRYEFGSGYIFENVNFTTSAATAVEIDIAYTTITLVGDNVIQAGTAAEGNSYGIKANGGLSIQGDGSLTTTAGAANSAANEAYSCGIMTAFALEISGGTIEATGGAATGGEASGKYGYSMGLYTSAGKLTINGGTVLASGGSAYASYGIMSKGALTITDGSVTAIGDKATGYSYGICCSYSSAILSLKGGTVKAIGGTASSGSYGIYCGYNKTNINITGGTIEATGGSLGISSVTDVTVASGLIVKGGADAASAQGIANPTKANICLVANKYVSVTSVAVDYTLYLKDGKVYKNSTAGGELANTGITYAESTGYTFTNVNFSTSAATAVQMADETAVITLVGENAVATLGGDTRIIGIVADGILTICGDGSLTVTTGSGHQVRGINCNGSLTISSGTVTAVVGDASVGNSLGITCKSIKIEGGTVKAIGGTVSGTDNMSCGIHCYGTEDNDKLSISGGTVTATGGTSAMESAGIFSKATIEISGGTVTAIGGEAKYSRGIDCDQEAGNGNQLIVTGGKLMAGSGAYVKGGKSRAILASKDLKASELVEVRNGNVDFEATEETQAISHKSTDDLSEKLNGQYVVMNYNGVTVTFDSKNGSAVDAQTVLSGTTVKKPEDPTRTNYVFDGWYKEAACTNKWDFATAVTGDITLYAKWLKNINACTIASIEDQTYYGGTLEPDLTVTFGGVTLTVDVDYTVSYADNINAGTATATITGIDSCTGTKDATFTINKSKVKVPEAVTNLVYDGSKQSGVIALFGAPYTLSGHTATDAGDYTAVAKLSNKDNYEWDLATPTSENQEISWTIAPKLIQVLGTTADGKEYDGTTEAVIGTVGTLDGAVTGDKVEIDTAVGSFADAKAGNGKEVTVEYTLKGGDADNYTVADATTSADIEKRSLKVTKVSADNKNYDGTTSTTAQVKAFTGKLGSEDVQVTVKEANFNDKYACDGKTVTISYEITGNDKDNYKLDETSVKTATASIAPIQLTVIGTTVETKKYDGTCTATVHPGTLQGVIEDESITLGAVGNFDSAKAGADKQVEVSYNITAGNENTNLINYLVPEGETLQASIDKAENPEITEKTGFDKLTKGGAAGNASITIGEHEDALSAENVLAVSVDGTELTEDQYKLEDGCVVVTLYKSYLNTLAVGEHTLRVELYGQGYDDMVLETTFTIGEPETSEPKAPGTGDDSHGVLWFCLLAFGGAATLAVRKKRRQA